MTIRGGGRPRDDRGSSQAHPSDAGDPEAPVYVERRYDRREAWNSRRANGQRGGGGLAGILRFLLFMVVLAAIVLAVGLTVLRPLVASAIVGWAADNPTALGLPFVADLVREDLGPALTDPASSDGSDVEFVVQPGDTAAAIADRLAGSGFLRDPRAFVFLAIERNLSDRLEAGTFILRKNMTPDQLVTSLLEAKTKTISITFREGLRLEQMTAKLQTLPLTMDTQAFYQLVTHPPASLLADYPWLDLPPGASLEGYLAPATYNVLYDITPEQLVRRLLDAFHQQVGDARLNVPASRGMSFYQILTLASLVEREAQLDEERPLIAGVYQNRLNPKLWKTGLLNADPTLLYAHDTLELQKLGFQDWQKYAFWAPWGAKLADVQLPADLAGYQTYTHKGLPPAPICTPSIASIDAALDPNTQAGYLYFLAIPNGGGKHAFAKTLAEHNANKAKYGYG